MTKILYSLVIFCTSQCMYDQGGKLKYDTIKLTNKAAIPFELIWVEIKRPQGVPTEIKRTINPGETTIVKIGEVGGYYPNRPARVVYKPILHNENFNQEFIIDLPNSKEFAFTAVKLADILNNIWVPGVLKADDKGNLSSFQYMNIQDQNQLTRIISNAGSTQTIK